MLGQFVLCAGLAASADPYAISTEASQVRADVIADLIAELGGGGEKGRLAASRLVRFGRHAVPALAAALDSPAVQVRFYAASALDLIDHPDATTALANILRNGKEDAAVRTIAVRAMGRAGHEPAVPVLLEMLHGDPAPPGTQRPAAAGAKAAGRDDAAGAHAAALGEELRFEVIQALACIGDDRAAGVLVDALGDPGARVRRAAAQGLGDRRMRGAVAGLQKLLGDTDASVAAEAARALGKYVQGAAGAVGDLIDACDRADVRVQRASRGALVAITGRSFPTTAQWRAWWAEHQAAAAAPPAPAAGQPPPEGPADVPAPPARARRPGEPPPALRPPWDWDAEPWK